MVRPHASCKCPMCTVVPDCETAEPTAASSPFLDWFHQCPLCLLPTEALSSRPGISTGTLSALCVLTVISTSNRRATSSWRGSCTVRPMREPVQDPQKATTPSLCTPKPKSFADEDMHARTHAHLHWPMTWMALAEGARTVTSQPEVTAFRHVSYCVVRARNGEANIHFMTKPVLSAICNSLSLGTAMVTFKAIMFQPYAPPFPSVIPPLDVLTPGCLGESSCLSFRIAFDNCSKKCQIAFNKIRRCLCLFFLLCLSGSRFQDFSVL